MGVGWKVPIFHLYLALAITEEMAANAPCPLVGAVNSKQGLRATVLATIVNNQPLAHIVPAVMPSVVNPQHRRRQGPQGPHSTLGRVREAARVGPALNMLVAQHRLRGVPPILRFKSVVKFYVERTIMIITTTLMGKAERAQRRSCGTYSSDCRNSRTTKAM